MLGHSQTKGRDNREPKLRPKPARQSSTLLMSGDWKRNYGTNCDTGMGESRRQTVQPRSLRPPRESSTLLTKYRYKVLEGALRERIRTIIRQVCKELGVQIVSGVLSREHVHMFVEIPPHIAVSDFVRRVKGRSSHRVQMEFPDLRKRYWGGISGLGATSPPRAATSRTMSYFSIFRSTNLPASAGSYSVSVWTMVPRSRG